MGCVFYIYKRGNTYILLILLGYLLKRIKFINEFFVKIGNKFVLMFVCRVCCLSIFTIKWTVLQIFAGT